MKRVPVTIDKENSVLQKVVDSNLDVGKLAMIGRVEYRKAIDAWIAGQTADIKEGEKAVKEVDGEIDGLCTKEIAEIQALFNNVGKALEKHGFTAKAKISVDCPNWDDENKPTDIRVAVCLGHADDTGRYNNGQLLWTKLIPISEPLRRLMIKRFNLANQLATLREQLHLTEIHKELKLAEFGEQLETGLYLKRLEGHKHGAEIVEFIQGWVCKQSTVDRDEIKKISAPKEE